MGAVSRVAVVLAPVALAGLIGCGSASHPATKATRSPSAKTEAEPQLTVGQASTAFAAFLPKFNRLPSDPSLLSQLTAGPLAASEKFLAGRGGPTVGTLSGEHLLVPFLTATRDGSSPPGRPATGRDSCSSWFSSHRKRCGGPTRNSST